MKALFFCFLIVASTAGAAAQQAARIDISKVGPQVGQQVAAFQIPDQSGRTSTLQSIMGPNGAMLVFSRSVDWCPYCKTQILELQSRLPELKAQGLGLAVITYDSPAIIADFSRRRGITFPLLSDVGSSTIRAYGVLNTTVASGTASYGIPFPGTLIVDRRGRVTSRFFEEAYQERNTTATIILALGKGKPPTAAKRLATEHLEITTYSSDEVVAPGSLFSLAFDVTPAKGMHVYAPGAAGYKVIALRLDPNPLLVVRPPTFPQSEIYEFKPLNEKVPVYQKPFRFVQTLAVNAAPDQRAALAKVTEIVVTGALDYQACDDRLCYPPRSIPLSYSVTLRPLDTQRTTVR